jgi:uncharacterized alpha-E superfamily protein
MLSRVANNTFWMARYLERAENTARLINVNSHLLLDLPKKIVLGWEPLIEILSDKAHFQSRFAVADEQNVVNFMITDGDNPSSIVSAISAARENARTIREMLPRELWEQINGLHLYAEKYRHDLSNRRLRYGYLNEIVQRNQMITGMMAGTMTHDACYEFVRIGRNLERADMTTRIIDVRSASLINDDVIHLSSFENIQWMGVLKSLSAYQMYRRQVRLRISRPDVIKFLLLEQQFPRSLYHTLKQVEAGLNTLPRHELVAQQVQGVYNSLLKASPQLLNQAQLHDFIDGMQLGLNNINSKIAAAYF